MSTSKRRDTTHTLNRNAGIVFGALYVLIGVVGFGVTSGLAFAAREGKRLVAFEINPLHNVVHLAIGAVLLGAAIQGLRPARIANGVVGVTYLVVALIGLVVAGDRNGDILALNQPDNVLHAFTGLALLATALFADKHVGSPATISDAATRSPRPAQHG